MKFIGTVIMVIATLRVFAQCGPPPTNNCAPYPASEMLLGGSDAVYFTFNEFNQYYGGITYGGATTLRLKVDSLNSLCKWSLKMIVDNNPAATSDPSEWETLYSYGAGTSAPPINLLSVRVYNGCNTPIMSGVYQNFPGTNQSEITLIDDISLNPAGTCGPNVNGSGSYISNFNEFTFTIDYRVIPGLTFSPGIYQLSIRFCLVEEN
jgi:hypothetical protein